MTPTLASDPTIVSGPDYKAYVLGEYSQCRPGGPTGEDDELLKGKRFLFDAEAMERVCLTVLKNNSVDGKEFFF